MSPLGVLRNRQILSSADGKGTRDITHSLDTAPKTNFKPVFSHKLPISSNDGANDDSSVFDELVAHFGNINIGHHFIGKSAGMDMLKTLLKQLLQPEASPGPTKPPTPEEGTMRQIIPPAPVDDFL